MLPSKISWQQTVQPTTSNNVRGQTWGISWAARPDILQPSSRIALISKLVCSRTIALDQFFFCNPVILESICYRTRAKRLINDSKMTGELRKIWTGIDSYTTGSKKKIRMGRSVHQWFFCSFLFNFRSNQKLSLFVRYSRPFFPFYSRIALVFLSVCSRTIADRLLIRLDQRKKCRRVLPLHVTLFATHALPVPKN